MAIASGQPFLDLLEWHPRDVDTLEQHYQDEASRERLAEKRRATAEAMGRG